MQPFLAVATLVAAFTVVNSETAYILQPIHHGGHHHESIVQPIHEPIHHQSVVSAVHQPRVLTSGWGWRPTKTITLALPSISRGWGWRPKLPSLQLGVYGGIRIGQKQQGWGKQQQGWGWQPQKQQGWGWQPPKQQGWGWQPQQHVHHETGWGWKKQQHGWGWDDDDDEDDYRALTIDQTALADISDDASSEEVADDDASSSVESEEQDSVEADSPLDYRRSIVYDPYFA
ncbi:Actin cytoskeleton-regulatory complex protein PAN1 [Orchesella cincta]|uniref:Actin cytoskeleton-regulatory complex protein PAN1 n=1 Tax=Orchesella cincta TaxID=48709 RepID=A0A1D2NJC6_ORCCI|nr:Actin cytoskeleton-regulatory complex protein PAN1 [Orchesella cincta]